MKKIAIMTWLHNGNYGTMLQAYALQRFLRDMDYDVTNVDYNPTSIERVVNLFRSRNSVSLFYEKFQGLLSRFSSDARKTSKVKSEKFGAFLEENFILTPVIRHTADLKKLSHKFDAYICGSDQIWSPRLLSPAFFLDYLEDDERKISYACSFGVSEVPNSKKSKIASLINRFQYVSVREQQGKVMAEDMIGRNCELLCDPTLLLTASQWGNLAGDRIHKEKYCLIYMLSYNKQYWEHAFAMASQAGLKPLVIPTVKESYKVNAELAEGIGPAEWVNLVCNADMVLTDSFHGSVFSLIFKIPFFVYCRFSESNKKSQNSRIDTLLSQFHMEARKVTDYSQFGDYKAPVGNDIDDIMAASREKSRKWLSNSILGAF